MIELDRDRWQARAEAERLREASRGLLNVLSMTCLEVRQASGLATRKELEAAEATLRVALEEKGGGR